MLFLVNKEHLFNEKMLDGLEMVEYENVFEQTLYVEKETFHHFEMLRAHLKVEGISIEIDSAYRSLEYQENLFCDFMKKYGLDYAKKVVAMPGTSEHHLGQAIDLIIKANGKWMTQNEDLIKEEAIFAKIHQALKYFGFILRYPKGKEKITGYAYEPWHIRYVGDDVAFKIGDKTLEEYLRK